MADWLSGWEHGYRRLLTVDRTKLGSDETNFIVMVKLSSANFDFDLCDPNGYMIRFTSDNSETLLTYERLVYDKSGENAVFFVEIPAVLGTGSTDTEFYMYWRLPKAIDEQFFDEVNIASKTGVSRSVNKPTENSDNPVFGYDILSQAWLSYGAGPTWVDETTDCNDAGAGDVNLLHTALTIGDALYIGGNHKFLKAIIEISQAGDIDGSYALVWEYYNVDTTWDSLPGITDGTTAFEAAAGKKNVTWTEPANWARCVVNGSASLFFIRARVTAIDTVNVQPQATRVWIAGRWDRTVFYFSVTVHADFPSASKYRAWYGAVTETGLDANRTGAYAYSADGEEGTWIKPNLGIVTWDGETINNILQVPTNYAAIVTYDPDGEADAKYLMAQDYYKDNGSYDNSVTIKKSADEDGPWTQIQQFTLNTVGIVPMTPEPKAYITAEALGNIVKRPDGNWMLYYQWQHDAVNKYREMCVVVSKQSDPSSAADKWLNLGTWHKVDAATGHYHSMKVYRVGEVYIGFVDIYDPGNNEMKVSLQVSRDGFTFTEIDATWIDHGAANTWNRYWSHHVSLVKEPSANTWRAYFGGMAINAVPWDATVGYGTIGYRRIGQIGTTGSFVTELMKIPSGGTLYVNGKPSNGGGKLEIEVQDKDGVALTNFAQADCTDVTADAYATEVAWTGGSLPTNRIIKLKFVHTDWILYSYTAGLEANLPIDVSNLGATWDGTDGNGCTFKTVLHGNERTTRDCQNSCQKADTNGATRHDGMKLVDGGTIESAGKVYKSQQFDGAADAILLGDVNESIFDASEDELTCEAIISADAINIDAVIASKYDAPGSPQHRTFYLRLSSQQLMAAAFSDGDANNYVYFLSDDNVITAIETWYYVASTLDLSAENIDLYVNDTEVASTKGTAGTPPIVFDNTAIDFYIGRYYEGGGAGEFPFDGYIEELRLSKGTRSAGWLLGTYNSLWDTLLTYGSEEEYAFPGGGGLAQAAMLLLG